MIKKIWIYIATFVAGIVAVLAVKSNYESFEDESPHDAGIKRLEDNIEVIDEKLEDIKENGVDDLNPQDTVDYWKNN